MKLSVTDLRTYGQDAHTYCLFYSIRYLGVNCTKEDLEALTNSNNEVELMDFNDNELYFEKIYK